MTNTLRYFLVTLTAASVLLTAGCFNKGPESVDSTQLRTFQGELSELSSFISGLDVTHAIVTDAKERVFLRSLLFDLDEYEGKEVKVFGTYSEEDVSGKPVDVLTVEKIDILSDVDLFSTELDELFTSKRLGIMFGYPSLLFDTREEADRVVLSGTDSNVAVTVKMFVASPELDAQVYIDSNYDSFDFNEAKVGSGLIDALAKNSSGSDKIVYVLLRDGYFYEVSFVNFSSDLNEKYETAFNEMLSTFEYVQVEEGHDLASEEEVDEDSDDDEKEENDDSSNSSNAPASSGSSKDPVIASFTSNADFLLDDYDSAVSFSFTDNSYFYIVYNSGSTQKRALFSYDGNNNFSKVAQFKKGAVQDWDLVSGNNVAYNRPQTLIVVGEEGGATEVSLEQGYRYFESLPLGFGLQYPMSWYYARSGDSYQFSDKPVDQGSVLVTVEILNGSFSTYSGSSVSSTVKQSSPSTFYVKLEDSVAKISGSSTYANEIRVMATTMISKSQ